MVIFLIEMCQSVTNTVKNNHYSSTCIQLYILFNSFTLLYCYSMLTNFSLLFCPAFFHFFLLIIISFFFVGWWYYFYIEIRIIKSGLCKVVKEIYISIVYVSVCIYKGQKRDRGKFIRG